MENSNYIIKQWKVVLYGNGWDGENKKILTIIGTMVDVFIKIKNVLDKEDYKTIVIEEVYR